MPNTSKLVEIDHVKEKLVELLDRFVDDDWYSSEEIAENLIAHGVTVSEGALPGADKATERSVAVDRIEEQRKPEDPAGHRKPEQEWISVKDRLPEENERVLACYINPLRKDRPPRMMVGEGTSTQIVKGKVYLWCGGWRSITHWMPLPQPPKGE